MTMATDYGTDVSTFPDLDPSFTLISGPRVVIEAIARRLVTPRGTMPGRPNDGIDVRQWLNDSVDAGTLARMHGAIESEIAKDERVQRAAVSLAFDAASRTLRITINVRLDDGPFDLVLSVDRVTLSLLAG